jgi:hypothetical protein
MKKAVKYAIWTIALFAVIVLVDKQQIVSGSNDEIHWVLDAAVSIGVMIMSVIAEKAMRIRYSKKEDENNKENLK